jgi:hypothetical protein
MGAARKYLAAKLAPQLQNDMLALQLDGVLQRAVQRLNVRHGVPTGPKRGSHERWARCRPGQRR